ncbi:MAG: Nramp family divalent metal transporter, partial [Brooklawnia sp.]
RYPALPKLLAEPFQFRNAGKYLQYFGAGALLAGMTIGSGEVVATPRLGSYLGATVGWVLLLAVVTKWLFPFLIGRHVVLTGQSVMDALARHKWFHVLCIIVTLIGFGAFWAGMAGLVGISLQWLTGVGSATMWALITTAVVFVMMQVGNFAFMEKVQIVCSIYMALAAVITLIAVKPDWGVALSSLIPTALQYPDWLAAVAPEIVATPVTFEVLGAFGLIGGGFMEYLAYGSWATEKHWGLTGSPTTETPKIDTSEKNIRTGLKWLNPVKIDVTSGFVLIALTALSFYLVGVFLLFPDHLVPSGFDLVQHQATYLAQTSTVLLWMFKVAVVIVFATTLYGWLDGLPRAYRMACRPLMPNLVDRISPKAWHLFWQAELIIVGTLWMLLNLNPAQLMLFAGQLSNVILPAVFLWMAIFPLDRMLPKQLRLRGAMKVYAVTVAIIFSIFAVVSAWSIFSAVT